MFGSKNTHHGGLIALVGGAVASGVALLSVPALKKRALRATTILKKDHSVASGRAMDQIAEGKGAKPKPFIRARAFRANAVWQSKSRKDDADEELEPVKKAAPPPKGRKQRSKGSPSPGGGVGGRWERLDEKASLPAQSYDGCREHPGSKPRKGDWP